jgi:hypothetical protein
MSKELVQSGKFAIAQPADPGLFGMLIVAALGLGFLVAEGAVLSAQGVQGVVYALMAVFAASTVSSIAGFAFSALCGALLFHLMDNPVRVVCVMILCSIAIQMLSVAALWRAIDWKSLVVFLIGGFPGVPVGVYLLLHLPTGTYRIVIGSSWSPTASTCCCAARCAGCRWDRCRMPARVFSAASPAGSPAFPARSSPSGAG